MRNDSTLVTKRKCIGTKVTEKMVRIEEIGFPFLMI